MWIKMPNGTLVNSEKVFIFDVDTGDGRSLYAQSESGGKRMVLAVYDNEQEAQDALKIISSALHDGKNFLALKY